MRTAGRAGKKADTASLPPFQSRSEVWFRGPLSGAVLCLIYSETQEFIKTQPGDVTSAGTRTPILFPQSAPSLFSPPDQRRATFAPSHVICHFPSTVTFLHPLHSTSGPPLRRLPSCQSSSTLIVTPHPPLYFIILDTSRFLSAHLIKIREQVDSAEKPWDCLNKAT